MKKLAGLLVVVLVLGSAAFLAYRIYKGRPQIDRAAQLAPANSYFYATLYLDPSNDQKRAFRDFLAHFPGAGTPDEAADAIGELLDGPLDSIGLDYATDVDPWLGDQVAFFASPGGEGETATAMLLATKDAEAAQAAANKAFSETEPEGSSFIIVDDFLVVGDEAAVDAIGGDEEEREALGSTEAFEKATEDIVEDRIALLFTNLQGLITLTGPEGALGASGLLNSLGMDLDAPSTTVVTMQDDALILEGKAGAPLGGALGPVVLGDGDNDLIPALPETAWLALGISDLGNTLTNYLNVASQMGVSGATEGIESLTALDLETEVLPWMGDGAAFIEGDDLLTSAGGLIAETTDTDASRDTVTRIRDRLTSGGAEIEEVEEGGLTGFSLKVPGLPSAFTVLGGDRFIFGYGGDVSEALLEPEGSLSDDETYRRAREDLGEDFPPTLFLDFQTARKLVEGARIVFTGELPESYEKDVKPWLEPLLYIGIGARRSGDEIVQRTAIGVS